MKTEKRYAVVCLPVQQFIEERDEDNIQVEQINAVYKHKKDAKRAARRFAEQELFSMNVCCGTKVKFDKAWRLIDGATAGCDYADWGFNQIYEFPFINKIRVIEIRIPV